MTRRTQQGKCNMTRKQARKVVATVIKFRLGRCDLKLVDVMLNTWVEQAVMEENENEGNVFETTLGEDGIDGDAILKGDLSCLKFSQTGAYTAEAYEEMCK